MTSQFPFKLESHKRPIGWQDVRIAMIFAVMIKVNRIIRALKKAFHLLLVVIR